MNTEKFTPGPWVIDINEDLNNGSSYQLRSYEKTKKEVKANANLIAAAPVVYNELKRLVNFLQENKIHVGTDGSLNMDLYDLIGKAKAALNKANPTTVNQ